MIVLVFGGGTSVVTGPFTSRRTAHSYLTKIGFKKGKNDLWTDDDIWVYVKRVFKPIKPKKSLR
jgi:hypothetical protein